MNKIQLAKILRHSKPNLWSSDPPAQTSRRPAPCDAQLRRVFESLGPGLGAIALNITAGPGTEGVSFEAEGRGHEIACSCPTAYF